MGILANVGCTSPSHPDRIPASLGWPCADGGSIGVTTIIDGALIIWSCFFVFIPDSVATIHVIHQDGGSRFYPRERYVQARDYCATHTSHPIDRTNLALCIYLSYPRVPEGYPPPRRGNGRRLRGVAVLRGIAPARLPRDSAFDDEIGWLINDFFYIESSEGDAAPVRIGFNCICAVAPATTS